MTAQVASGIMPPCIETGVCPNGHFRPASLKQNEDRNKRMAEVCLAEYPLIENFVDSEALAAQCGIQVSNDLVFTSSPGAALSIVGRMQDEAAARQAERPGDTRTRISKRAIRGIN